MDILYFRVDKVMNLCQNYDHLVPNMKSQYYKSCQTLL